MTTEREQRIAKVFAQRRHDLTVIFENVHDHHNISACLRSCDATGIAEVFIISSREKKQIKLSSKSSASAAKWLTIHHYFNVKECFEEVRKKFSKIYTTRLDANAIDLYEMDFTHPVALVFGNEHDGVSEEAANLSDGNFVIPQVGMIQSLNVSVACAVTLYEAFRQRRNL